MKIWFRWEKVPRMARIEMARFPDIRDQLSKTAVHLECTWIPRTNPGKIVRR